MAGSNGPRETGPKNGPKNDPARGGPGHTPPPAAAPEAAAGAKPSFLLRVPRAIGGMISAPFKVVRRIIAAAGGQVAAAGGAAAHVIGSVCRRERLTALSAVVAAVAALLAWRGTVDTETRRVSGQLLNEFNSDEMWKARLTLQRYYYLVSGDKTAPADLARQTEDYFKAFVYQKSPPPAGRQAQDRNKFGSDRDKQEEFLRQVDQSRQKIKNFYEDVIVFSENGQLTRAFQEKVLKARFYRNAGDFLECFWLPVELGQNAALYQGRKDDSDKRACQVVDWYREKYPVAGRKTATCVPYAPRQPDFCVDPKAEASE
jgi:hypothetical protein